MLLNFFTKDFLKDVFRNTYNINLSDSFIDCSHQQLTKNFILQTGLTINKLIGFIQSSNQDFYLTTGIISSFSCYVWINNHLNFAKVNWKSKSGHIYKTDELVLDCNDIEFWFEGLDPLLYYQQLYPNVTLPFKLKDLSYELVVQRLNMDMVIEMVLNENEISNASFIIDKIDKMMNDYNNKSMKKDRKDGVVHNWKKKVEENKLIYDIDTGSAGAPFLKKLLVYLSKMNCFTKVEVS